MNSELGKLIWECTQPARDLDDMAQLIIATLEWVRSTDTDNVTFGYLSGPMTLFGPEWLWWNYYRMASTSTWLRENCDPFLFAPTDIFTPVRFANLDDNGAKNEDYLEFWDTVLRYEGIKRGYFMPGWRRSSDSKAENKIGRKCGWKKFYLASWYNDFTMNLNSSMMAMLAP